MAQEMKKWFLIGFAVRAILAVVVLLMALRNFEAGMLFLADLPAMLFLAAAEMTLPHAVALPLKSKFALGDSQYRPR